MLNLKQIDTNIRNIKTASAVMDKRVHETGVSIIDHARLTGDYTKINGLFAAMGKSLRKEAFKVWVTGNTPLKYDDKSGMFTKVRKSTQEYDSTSAEAVPFWDYSNEMVKTTDVDKLGVLNKDEVWAAYLDTQATKLANAIESGKTKGDVTAAHLRLAA